MGARLGGHTPEGTLLWCVAAAVAIAAAAGGLAFVVLNLTVGVAQRHVLAYARRLGMDRLHQRQEAQVEAQHLVFGVVGDPCDLVWRQTRVDRVHHAAAAGNPEVQLEVAVAVPRQRAHAFAVAHAQGRERVGEPPRARVRVAVRVAVDGTFRRPRDDLGVAVAPVGVPQDRRDHQRPVHHQTEHGPSLRCAALRSPSLLHRGIGGRRL